MATTFRVNLDEMRVVFSKTVTITEKYSKNVCLKSQVMSFLQEHIISRALLYFSLHVNINELPTQALAAEAHVEPAESLLHTCVVVLKHIRVN